MEIEAHAHFYITPGRGDTMFRLAFVLPSSSSIKSGDGDGREQICHKFSLSSCYTYFFSSRESISNLEEMDNGFGLSDSDTASGTAADSGF